MAWSSWRVGGGQFDDGVGGKEVTDSKAQIPGKGEFMEAAETPAEDGGSKNGWISGVVLHGAGRFFGVGGNGSSCLLYTSPSPRD